LRLFLTRALSLALSSPPPPATTRSASPATAFLAAASLRPGLLPRLALLLALPLLFARGRLLRPHPPLALGKTVREILDLIGRESIEHFLDQVPGFLFAGSFHIEVRNNREEQGPGRRGRTYPSSGIVLVVAHTLRGQGFEQRSRALVHLFQGGPTSFKNSGSVKVRHKVFTI
jgi:hypothetical protein